MTDETSPLQEQVLVAAFPNQPPEVHVGSLDVKQRTLNLSEASVLPNGGVHMQKRRSLSLAEASTVDQSDGMLAILGPSGSLLVQLHVEDPGDQQIWVEALQAAIRGDIGAGVAQTPKDEDTDDEVRELQARSRQLQQRIVTLEAAGERRDRTMHKMIRRLDGAMQMLSAVQEMCMQQRRVVAAQKAAISELSRECGVAVEDTTSGSNDCTSTPATAPKASSPQSRPSAPAAVAAAAPIATTAPADTTIASEGEVASQATQMMALLQQADDLQRTLRALEAMGITGDAADDAGDDADDADDADGADRPREAPSVSPALSGADDGQTQAADVAKKAAAQQKVEQELEGLLQEKEKFEGMLADSQTEHETLLKRLNDMRSLMGALGMNLDEDDED
mmetsp:Transcript_75837/g.190798  ORF Transcript_75837/g.190798 Transcript_75837/m.190798 type:complete len:393 (-) Transcript_75837:177-1355(-)